MYGTGWERCARSSRRSTLRGLAKYEALVQQDVERFRRECEERGIDPNELMRG